MSSLQNASKRGKELTSLILNHGPITVDMLHRMTEPPMAKKKIRRSLATLQRRGLVEPVCISPHTVFYQISQAPPMRAVVGEILGSDEKSALKPLLRRQDRTHHMYAEFWIFILKKIFPDAIFVREHDAKSHSVAKSLLQLSEPDYDLVPDFIMILPKNGELQRVSIAFEIERTRKTQKRIVRKLKKYLDKTLLDGLVYICDSGRLSDSIRLLYDHRLVVGSNRIKHYGQNFFLFSDSLSGGSKPLNRFFNANGENVSILRWCGLLRETKRTLRRDEKFRVGGVLPPFQL